MSPCNARTAETSVHAYSVGGKLYARAVTLKPRAKLHLIGNGLRSASLYVQLNTLSCL
jgi:hypothetical protein